MTKILKITFTFFFILYVSNIYSQGFNRYPSSEPLKKSPDIFEGFRDFKFYTPITDYYNYKYKSIDNYKLDSPGFEIILPNSESSFLETKIKKVFIKEYKNNIIEITILLENNVLNILNKMFNYEEPEPYRIGRYYAEPEEDKWREPDYRTYYTSIKEFEGKKTILEFGKVQNIKYYSKKKDPSPILKGISFKPLPRYVRREETSISSYYLTFSAKKYKDKIDSKQVKEHYDTYLSDFGIKHHPKKNEHKSIYKIPLFEFNNTYYVRALFGDVIENLILDTGADQLIISKNLYYRLKNKNLLEVTDIRQKMTVANGVTVKLKKVIIKHLQLNDLNVNYIEAYVNTADDISLLGQSFLKRFGNININNKLNLLTISNLSTLAQAQANTKNIKNKPQVYLNFIDVLRAKGTKGDFYQMMKTDPSLEHYITSPEGYIKERKAEDPTLSDDQIAIEYKNWEAEYVLYKTRRFDYQDVNFEYDRGAINGYGKGSPKWQGMDNSFIQPGPSNSFNLPGVEKPVMLNHKNTKTKNSGSYFINNEAMVSILIIIVAGLVLFIAVSNKKKS